MGIRLWLHLDDTARLAARIEQATDSELEGQSHYITMPAADRLADEYPAIAARVYRALAVRIVNAGKSQYYFEALDHFRDTFECYARAGLARQWHALVEEVRQRHSRKRRFMFAFEYLAKEARRLLAKGEWGPLPGPRRPRA